jgi:hypothetical protein
MSKIEVPEGMGDEQAEKVLSQRAKARSGSKSAKESTRSKAGESATSWADIVFWLVVIASIIISINSGAVGGF